MILTVELPQIALYQRPKQRSKNDGIIYKSKSQWNWLKYKKRYIAVLAHSITEFLHECVRTIIRKYAQTVQIIINIIDCLDSLIRFFLIIN